MTDSCLRLVTFRGRSVAIIAVRRNVAVVAFGRRSVAIIAVRRSVGVVAVRWSVAVVAVRRRSPSVIEVRWGVGVSGRWHIVAIWWGVVRIGYRVPISTVIPSVPNPLARGDLNACIAYSWHRWCGGVGRPCTHPDNTNNHSTTTEQHGPHRFALTRACARTHH